MVLDARSLVCPKPILMAEEALTKIQEGSVEVLVDHKATVKNLEKFARNNGYYLESEKEGTFLNNFYRVRIVKGYSCEIAEEEAEPELKKSLLVIVASDVMGKDEDIGKVLMKGFFETMKVYKQIPHTLFFLNAGVKLTTLDEEMIPILKELEAMGVEIFSCGTCLKHYNLEQQLKVGHRGATTNITEGMQDFAKTIWIG
ncbi:MAG: sulfurtransferase-like selenium metabolism protein YedF [bacterium]